jgi:hypothetical protein
MLELRTLQKLKSLTTTAERTGQNKTKKKTLRQGKKQGIRFRS